MKKSTPKSESSSEQVYLNNFRWVHDSYHREEAKSITVKKPKFRANFSKKFVQTRESASHDLVIVL